MSGATESPLTERQQQILGLLQMGKVNKEIANELGIGVGTVKQHVVALFRRLNVKTRTMAALKKDHAPLVLVSDGMLERRPIIAMSLALPENTATERAHEMLAILDRRAEESGALFISRKTQGGDVIFGVRSIAEDDVLRALRLAYLVFSDLFAQDAPLATRLRGGLTAGLAVISMGRHGGWSGEAIASESIAQARDLQQLVPQGHVMLGQTALDLIHSMGIGERRALSPAMTFSQIAALRWTGERGDHALVGRETEIKMLSDLMHSAGHGQGHVLALTGELGMGKTRLAREIVRMCLASRGEVRFLRCQPASVGACVIDISDPSRVVLIPGPSETVLLQILQAQPIDMPAVVIIDDIHWLPEAARRKLCEAAMTQTGKLIVLASRRPVCTELPEKQRPLSLHLARLPKTVVSELLQTNVDSMGLRADSVKSGDLRTLATLASGVPMFAVELGKQAALGSSGLTLALLTSVCARLDALQLDHKMLRALSRFAGGLTPQELARHIGEDEGRETTRRDIERLLTSGVVSKDQDDRLTFKHPLVRHVVEQLNLS